MSCLWPMSSHQEINTWIPGRLQTRRPPPNFCWSEDGLAECVMLWATCGVSDMLPIVSRETQWAASFKVSQIKPDELGVVQPALICIVSLTPIFLAEARLVATLQMFVGFCLTTDITWSQRSLHSPLITIQLLLLKLIQNVPLIPHQWQEQSSSSPPQGVSFLI